jgi:hypothetical protein
MRIFAKLCAAAVVCTALGLCVDRARAYPWQVGKNKLPRLSSQAHDIAVENLTLSRGHLIITGKRRKP